MQALLISSRGYAGVTFLVTVRRFCHRFARLLSPLGVRWITVIRVLPSRTGRSPPYKRSGCAAARGPELHLAEAVGVGGVDAVERHRGAHQRVAGLIGDGEGRHAVAEGHRRGLGGGIDRVAALGRGCAPARRSRCRRARRGRAGIYQRSWPPGGASCS